MGAAHHPEASGGLVAWGGLTVGVGIYDALTQRETMTNWFRRQVDAHPIGMAALTATVVAHLWGKFPEGMDPIEIMFEHIPHNVD